MPNRAVTPFLPPGALDSLGPGLNVALVHDALRDGEASANSCTSNDPTILPGLLRWARTIRGLRDRLASFGWKRCNVRGLPTVVSPDGTVAITVSTGDEGTGTDGLARTKYPKGAAALFAVIANQLVFEAEGFEITPLDDISTDTKDRATWYLLFIKDGDEIRAELSLPSGIGGSGHVEGFVTRYRLPPLDLSEKELQRAADEPDIEIHVARK